MESMKFPVALLQLPFTSFLLCPNSFLSTLFSNILGLCCSLTVKDQVSRPYKTTGRIERKTKKIRQRDEVRNCRLTYNRFWNSHLLGAMLYRQTGGRLSLPRGPTKHLSSRLTFKMDWYGNWCVGCIHCTGYLASNKTPGIRNVVLYTTLPKTGQPVTPKYCCYPSANTVSQSRDHDVDL